MMDMWDGEHLSEVALSCLADAQDVVDPVARVHAESCAQCTLRIGELALESHTVGSTLRLGRELARKKSVARVHRFPTVLVGVAATLAIACGAPAIIETLPNALAWAFAAPRIVPVLTTTAVAVARTLSSGPAGAAVSIASTFALALFGYAVARASSKGVAS
jgi:hypothetical protein